LSGPEIDKRPNAKSRTDRDVDLSNRYYEGLSERHDPQRRSDLEDLRQVVLRNPNALRLHGKGDREHNGERNNAESRRRA
jgi:hypothetical protein